MCSFLSDELRQRGPGESDWPPSGNSDTLPASLEPSLGVRRQGGHGDCDAVTSPPFLSPFPFFYPDRAFGCDFFFFAAEASVNVMGDPISVRFVRFVLLPRDKVRNGHEKPRMGS